MSQNISKAVSHLWKKDANLKKKHGVAPGELTYWDCDTLRASFVLEKKPGIALRNVNGLPFQTIIVALDPSSITPKDGEVVQDCAQFFQLILASRDLIKSTAIKDLMNEFPGASFSEVSSEKTDSIMQYCKRMDEEIMSIAKKLKDIGEKDIFKKLISEFGTARESEQLPKRIRYYELVVNEFKKNKSAWKNEMQRLGLI